MSIFNNNKSKIETNKNIGLTDYQHKLNERKEEYDYINEILRGMRSEVSNLMDEIKEVTDNLVKKNAELFLLEQSTEDLKRSYDLLQQNVKYEEEAFNKVNQELAKIKNEINENMPYYDKLNVVKKEYESVSLQLIVYKAELEKTKNESNLKTDVSDKDKLENNLEIPMATKKLKCKAKTKTGSKCKRYAVDGTLYCSFHTSKVKSKK